MHVLDVNNLSVYKLNVLRVLLLSACMPCVHACMHVCLFVCHVSLYVRQIRYTLCLFVVILGCLLYVSWSVVLCCVLLFCLLPFCLAVSCAFGG